MFVAPIDCISSGRLWPWLRTAEQRHNHTTTTQYDKILSPCNTKPNPTSYVGFCYRGFGRNRDISAWDVCTWALTIEIRMSVEGHVSLPADSGRIKTENHANTAMSPASASAWRPYTFRHYFCLTRGSRCRPRSAGSTVNIGRRRQQQQLQQQQQTKWCWLGSLAFCCWLAVMTEGWRSVLNCDDVGAVSDTVVLRDDWKPLHCTMTTSVVFSRPLFSGSKRHAILSTIIIRAICYR